MNKQLQYLIVILFIYIAIGCVQKNDVEKEKYNFKLIEEYQLELPEPSDLSLSFDRNNLWFKAIHSSVGLF